MNDGGTMQGPKRSIIRLMLAGTTAASVSLGLGQALERASAATIPYTLIQNVSYCTLNGVNELADVYYPTALPASPMPVVLYFHGGSSGNYKSDIRSPLPHLQSQTLNALINNGYEVISFNWGSSSGSTTTDTITWEFAKCAVRTVRANATSFDIDPKRIAAWGDSNGAGIASILGTTTTAQGWDVGPYLSTSSRVEAVVDWSGGATGDQYITRDDATHLIQVGATDPNMQWAPWFYSLFQQAGVPAQFQSVQNAGHQFIPVIDPITGLAKTTSPSPDQLTQQVVTFLNNAVKNNSNPLPQ
jgi:acetyl esterase/lipase